VVCANASPAECGSAWNLLTGGCDTRRLESLEMLGKALELPCVAAGDVHMHRRKPPCFAGRDDGDSLENAIERGGLMPCFPNGERLSAGHCRAYSSSIRAAADGADAHHRRTLYVSRSMSCATKYPEEIVPAGRDLPPAICGALTEKKAVRNAGRRAYPPPCAKASRHEFAPDRRTQVRAVLSHPLHDVVAVCPFAEKYSARGRGSAR